MFGISFLDVTVNCRRSKISIQLVRIPQQQHDDPPSYPVMYATPKPSGTTWTSNHKDDKEGTERKVHTSPHPYTGKCFEKTADVLSTHLFDLASTGSENNAGASSPSRNNFLRPTSYRPPKRINCQSTARKNTTNSYQKDACPRPAPSHCSSQAPHASS